MKALVLGFAVLAIAILAILPSGLGWGADILAFLKGALPVIAILISFVLIFIGIADIKDRADLKKKDE